MPAPTAESLLAAAQQRPKPVYLLVGEPFQTEAVAHALIALLVPPERRSFSLESYDGAARRSARSSTTHRTLAVRRHQGICARADAVHRRREAVTSPTRHSRRGGERPMEAAEKLLALLALAGWTQDALVAADWNALTKADATAVFGPFAAAGEADALDDPRRAPSAA
jgi:hypothetical protein